MSALIAIVLKGSILMIAAAATVTLLYRASAATRHFVWTLAIAGLLLLPLFALALPSVEIAVPIPSAEIAAPIDAPRPVTTPPANSIAQTGDIATIPLEHESGATAAQRAWVMLPAAIYMLGLVTLLGRLVVQHRTARRITRDAARVSDPGWTSLLESCAMRIGLRRRVTLLRSCEQLMPMTMGALAPTIVIPADADTWDDERRTAVLLHELAHIARYDCLTQMLSAIATAAYWIHPGVWYVARRLRIERELACDDRVLAAGTHARSYAGHLLEIAYSWSGRRAPAVAVGMAGSRKLEGRMRAVLDPRRNRATPGKRAWLVGAALGAALLLPIAAITTTTTTVSADMRSSLMAQGDDRAASAPDTVSGTWEVRPSRSAGRVSLTVTMGSSSMNGEVDANEIERLTGQRLSDFKDKVRFTVSREAGSLDIEGTVKDGAGRGTVRFVPSQTFITGLEGRGFARPSTVALMTLAHHDLGFAFIDELAAQKYERPVVSELVRAANHGVDLEFVRDTGRAGYRVGTLDALIRFRDHGVDPAFIRALRAQGVSDLASDDLVRARDHGVDADYAGGLTRLGYGSLPFETLVRARDHGVDPQYLSALRDLGFAKLPLDEVIRTRDHGVDPEYIRGMRRAGHTLTLEELITARDHGVTPDYIDMMASLGYKGLPIDTLLRLRDHGVTPDYVVETQKRGFKNLSAEEIIRMRDRGMASSDYRIDRILAYLGDTTLARTLEKAFNKALQHAGRVMQQSDKATQKAEKAAQKAADKLSR